MERNDYGVPGSPVWWEPAHEEIVSIEILGIEFDEKSLPSRLVDAIYSLSEVIEWEMEDGE